MDEPYLVSINSDQRLQAQTLSISAKLALELRLQEGETVSLSAGRNSMMIKIKISKTSTKNKQISFHPKILKGLRVPSERRYGIVRDDDGLRLGPVVGIMADLYHDPQRPFGGQSYFISQVLAAGRKMGLLCFAFSPASVNFHRKSISGYRYSQNGWVKGVFSIPDVVYPREPAYCPNNLRTRARLEGLGTRFINPPLIGKWQTYKLLSQEKELSEYIPDTKFIKNFKQVDRMINRYRAVYMKPVSGSQGKNIVRVMKKKASPIYQYQYQMNNQSYRGTAANMLDLQRNLHRVMGNRSYIVQQRINLLRSQGNILDVRILVQKDDSGVFKVTGKACRIGNNGSITSNISSGGKGRRVDQVLKQCLFSQGTRDRILTELDYLSITVAQKLEEKHDNIGELGIDVGIDQMGKLWFIEANLRPGRQVFSLIGDKKTRMISIERPMAYARYLAGFSGIREEEVLESLEGIREQEALKPLEGNRKD